MKKLLLILSAFYLSVAPQAQAKWASFDDAISKVEFYNAKILVNKDGTSEETVEEKQTILKEQFRSQAANYRIIYNGDSEELKLIEAKTINGNKEYQVDITSIEDQPLASAHQGFDQHRQLLIAFPNVEIGSSIYFKYTKKIKKPILNNYYSFCNFLGSTDIVEKVNITITSNLGLKIEKNDPNNAIRILETSNKDNLQIIEISNVKPIYHQIINESSSSIQGSKYSWVALSSLNKWEDLALALTPKYMRVINQPLPDSFKEIQIKASKEINDTTRINIVTSLLNEQVQYMGDWRSIDGAFFPRDLDQVAKSQIADCKDFSAVTAAILNQMGYRARAVLVRRGVGGTSFNTATPQLGNFNHAIVKVINDKGTVYWIDPTNTISMAGGIFQDIENKKALVLDEEKPSYEIITSISSHNSKRHSAEIIEIEKDEVIISGIHNFQGEAASMLTASELFLSEDHLKDYLFNNLSGTFLKQDQKLAMKLPDLKSRIVTDLVLSYKFKQKNKLFNTNLGKGYALDSIAEIDNIITASEEQIGDIMIGRRPYRNIHNTIALKDVRLKSIEKLNAQIDTKWVKIKQEAKLATTGTVIDISIEIKDNIIPNDALNSDEYKKLKYFIEKYIKNAAVIF